MIEPESSRRAEIQRLLYRELRQPLLRRICSSPEPIVIYDLATEVWEQHSPLLMLYGLLEAEIYITVKSAIRQLERDGLVKTMMMGRQVRAGYAEVDVLVAPASLLVAMAVLSD